MQGLGYSEGFDPGQAQMAIPEETFVREVLAITCRELDARERRFASSLAPARLRNITMAHVISVLLQLIE
jgi:hypothetical protein